ncbi:MAG: tripartite tricarboxylate transporter TctB family protein [Desulfobacterales bacterium]|nr:tripartite tricarboxylate transporter TctB family protein [Desulfobacterales bacterium]
MWHRTDIIETVLLVFVGIGVVIESIRLKVGTPLMPQPGFFPLIAGLLLVGLALIFLLQNWLQRGLAPQQPQEAFGELRRPAILVASMSVYTALLMPVGYVLPTILLTALILRVLGVTSWRILGRCQRGALGGDVHILFGRILGIDLPAGVLSFLG